MTHVHFYKGVTHCLGVGSLIRPLAHPPPLLPHWTETCRKLKEGRPAREGTIAQTTCALGPVICAVARWYLAYQSEAGSTMVNSLR